MIQLRPGLAHLALLAFNARIRLSYQKYSRIMYPDLSNISSKIGINYFRKISHNGDEFLKTNLNLFLEKSPEMSLRIIVRTFIKTCMQFLRRVNKNFELICYSCHVGSSVLFTHDNYGRALLTEHFQSFVTELHWFHNNRCARNAA